MAEEEEDDVGPEVRVEDVSAAEGRVGRAGDRERGEADDGGRRHREDGLVVAEHLARREEDVLEPRERDDVQAPEHELEGRGRPDPLDAEEDDVRLRRVPEHEQRGEPPVLRPRQAARVGPRGAGRGREDRGGGVRAAVVLVPSDRVFVPHRCQRVDVAVAVHVDREGRGKRVHVAITVDVDREDGVGLSRVRRDDELGEGLGPVVLVPGDRVVAV